MKDTATACYTTRKRTNNKHGMLHAVESPEKAVSMEHPIKAPDILSGHKRRNKMAEITLTGENFAENVLKSDKPVLVDFWAAWCGPCRMLGPVLEELSGEADFKIVKVDVDAEPALAMQFGIESIPTLLVFRNGQLVNRSVGLVSKADILRLMQ